MERGAHALRFPLSCTLMEGVAYCVTLAFTGIFLWPIRGFVHVEEEERPERFDFPDSRHYVPRDDDDGGA